MAAKTIEQYKAMQVRRKEAESSMNELRRKVMDHLDSIFVMENMQVEDYPFLPGGVVVRDAEGAALLFYWDILTGKVVWK